MPEIEQPSWFHAVRLAFVLAVATSISGGLRGDWQYECDYDFHENVGSYCTGSESTCADMHGCSITSDGISCETSSQLEFGDMSGQENTYAPASGGTGYGNFKYTDAGSYQTCYTDYACGGVVKAFTACGGGACSGQSSYNCFYCIKLDPADIHDPNYPSSSEYFIYSVEECVTE